MKKHLLLLVTLCCIIDIAAAQTWKFPKDDVSGFFALGGPGIIRSFDVPVTRETDRKDKKGRYVVPAYCRLRGDDGDDGFFDVITLTLRIRNVALLITITDSKGKVLWKAKREVYGNHLEEIDLAPFKPGARYSMNIYSEKMGLLHRISFPKLSAKPEKRDKAKDTIP